jgi:hypothetical protein
MGHDLPIGVTLAELELVFDSVLTDTRSSVCSTGDSRLGRRSREALLMSNLKIGARPAASVGDLLRWLGEYRTLPADLQANAAYWATVVADRMDQRDVETVAWLLLEASSDRRVPFAERRSARCWAAYLEGRT